MNIAYIDSDRSVFRRVGGLEEKPDSTIPRFPVFRRVGGLEGQRGMRFGFNIRIPPRRRFRRAGHGGQVARCNVFRRVGGLEGVRAFAASRREYSAA